jgi:hypothetical protein
MDNRPDESPLTVIEGIAETEALASVARPDTSQAERNSLTADVTRFIDEIKAKYPHRLRLRPKALKTRIIFLIDQALPPHKRKGGRPRKSGITRATEMFQTQNREVKQGKRRAIDWRKIALECVPGYNTIRSQVHSRAALGRLRNSVYAWLRRKRTYKRRRRLSPSGS